MIALLGFMRVSGGPVNDARLDENAARYRVGAMERAEVTALARWFSLCAGSGAARSVRPGRRHHPAQSASPFRTPGRAAPPRRSATPTANSAREEASRRRPNPLYSSSQAPFLLNCVVGQEDSCPPRRHVGGVTDLQAQSLPAFRRYLDLKRQVALQGRQVNTGNRARRVDVQDPRRQARRTVRLPVDI